MQPSATLAFPLTPLQQGMLFRWLSTPWDGVDVEQIVIRLHEDVDVIAMTRAWQEVVARHPALRTRLRWTGLDEPVQEAVAHVAVELHRAELPGDGSERDALDDWLQQERLLPFDLAAAPLMRWSLLQPAGHGAVLVWTFHHVLLDGRSFAHVLAEVFAGYDARNGQVTAQAPSPHRFAEHVAWLRSRDRARERTFWTAHLAGYSPAVSLPLPASTSARRGRGRVRTRLPVPVADALRRLAQDTGVTLNTLVQGAWALLLSRYCATSDIVFGCVRACRRASVPDADRMVGTFINTVPFRVAVDEDAALLPWLCGLREVQRGIAPHEHAALADIQRWCQLPVGTDLFATLLVFDHASLQTQLRSCGVAGPARSFELHERTPYPLALYAYGDRELALEIVWERSRFDATASDRMLGHLSCLLTEFAHDPHRPLHAIPMLPGGEAAELTRCVGARVPYAHAATVADLFTAQVQRTPDAVAVRQSGRSLTYRELDRRSNQLAHHLHRLGVGPEQLVGIYTMRSLAMVVAVLGVLKAGGAYVPLDPSYPAARNAAIVADAKLRVLVSEPELAGQAPVVAHRVLLDAAGQAHAAMATHAPARTGSSASLAYVIYTSGSTGQPKGVMVEHRNVVSFFAAMDACLGPVAGGVWLAVTSLAFDISVLELLWTLTRGFEVVVHPSPAFDPAGTLTDAGHAPRKKVSFSLFYFASDHGAAAGAKYDLLLAGARFADANGFEAVWTPERHFHAFGGLYPNPALTSAALATMTKRIALRAGSVVLPLHHPVRVAEEWALVDNLSGGRIGIAFASGWQRDDFVLAPHSYADRKQVMLQGIETVRRLWRGEAVALPGPDGKPVRVRTLPRPVQAELPVWITAAGNVATYELAGRLGTNVLTHLLGQSLADLARCIAAYRDARQQAGHAGQGRVTLMLHTFVGASDAEVLATVRRPMLAYLRSSLDLAKSFIGSFPTFKTQDAHDVIETSRDFDALGTADVTALLEHSFQRYFTQCGLFGSVATCLRMVEKVAAVGVDEIACLIDFGVDHQVVVDQFAALGELQRRAVAARDAAEDASIPAAIARFGVTHLQCTPSLARMVLAQPGGPAALGCLRKLLVGGEALPAALARELHRHVGAGLVNMYGPTETTVWSASHPVRADQDPVPIGRPLANTEMLVLDARQRLLPVGVPGELCIGGDGVARGYWQQPARTAERFCDHPIRGAAGGRMYRTGDRVRLRIDGELEFLGRLDRQVKVRGYRIELGEIESRLAEHPSVRECAVVVRAGAEDGSMLVGYFVRNVGAEVDRQGLRAWLGARLPQFMVPGVWVELPALPQTPNGKIDRRALPAPLTSANEQAPAPSAAADSELLCGLAAIWCDVLALPSVPRDANFFDLGGHSLLTVQVQGRIRRQLGFEVQLVDLFRCTTLHQLANHLADGMAAADGQSAEHARARREGEQRRHAIMRRRPHDRLGAATSQDGDLATEPTQ
jgi:natural product biosynthesis luciferase-like monooxygenase protein